MLTTHPAFPRGANIEFVQVQSRTRVTQRTWERGSGETWACGTGACAVAVAGALTDRTERDVRVQLTGGELRCDWRAESGHVFMTGPAVEVFSGEYPSAAQP